ncbi:O-acyltransferase like protein-like [Homalodisca vitripennis]|uniref:O-acyltransferase like protein-like n=1 Tax=Homalodisca vitripennis TaxID=197043 RepID=UPI001EEA4A01|nr:O-acyltransferase like protein-like [Homalodisca vitripennis]
MIATVNAYMKQIGSGTILKYWQHDRNVVFDDPFNYYGFHYRLPSFCMGLGLGYFLFHVKYEKHSFVFTKKFWCLGWVSSVVSLSVFVVATVIVSNPNHKFSPWMDPLYQGFQRPVFCAGLSWIIFASFLGYGGLLNQFLSWPGFRPLGKLTYGVFLLHFVAIFKQSLSIQDPMIFSLTELVC